MLLLSTAPKPGAIRGLRFLELSREHIRLAVSPRHPFARRRAVSIEEAAREPFIGLIGEKFPDYHFFIDTVFTSARNKPKIAEERDSVAGIIAGVEGGSGVALAGDRFVYIFGPRIKLLRLTPEPKTVPLGISARKGGGQREQHPKLARRYYPAADKDLSPRLVARSAGFPGCKSVHLARFAPHPSPAPTSRLDLPE